MLDKHVLVSHNNNHPIRVPFRIILPNGITRTDPSTFTLEELTLAGYQIVADSPIAQPHEIVEWINGTWVIRSKSQLELDSEKESLATTIRTKRNQLLIQSDWTQVLDAPVDQLAWKTYRQALRDITAQQGFPHVIIWPESPTSESSYDPSN